MYTQTLGSSTEVPRPHPEGWDETADRLSREEGVVLLLGATDTGKTTFSVLLASLADAAGTSYALVDVDVGQSEVGPPACASVRFGPKSNRAPGEADFLAFIGSVSPSGASLEHLAATESAIRFARSRASLVIADTTGFVSGSLGQRLKLAKISLVGPRFVVALQRSDECEPILRPYKRSEAIEIIRLSALPLHARRSSALRAQRREGKFARYFASADMSTFRLADVALTRTWLYRSAGLGPQALRFIARTAGVKVLYAEAFDGHLGVVCSSSPADTADLAGLQEEFRTERITFTPAEVYRHLLVGLMDHNGKTLGLGLLESVDFGKGVAAIVTPMRALSAVRRIDFGLIRLQPNGREVGLVRSGTI